MTGTDIKTLAEAEVDDTIETADVIQFVNSCLLEFADSFRKTSTQTITVSDATLWAARTAGHYSIVKITEDGEDYTGEFELDYDRTNIRFDAEGTFVVTSLILPAAITAITDTIAVNAVFEPAIGRYVAAFFKRKDNDQNPDGLRMAQEAEKLIQKASALIAMGDQRKGQRVAISR